MGNIFGRPRVVYVTYERYYPRPANNAEEEDDDEDDSTSDDASYAPYGWGKFLSDMCCCPWFGGSSGTRRRGSQGWNGAVIGIVRRRGCQKAAYMPIPQAHNYNPTQQVRDHWALAFKSSVDVSKLPRRMSGFRTRIPSRCRRTCARPQRVYVLAGSPSSSSSAS
ncbi:hypothetical protein F5Y05DRAFT_410914 [Hypoxylon sp. FL0543]|nr:hypothetical protein F5Y05DRAFT_410914 [Hypoxylon sp. FL0543]